MPAVETPQGQWLYDTTPTIQWFETVYPDIPIMPKNKALAFVSLLLEDYGDEWLWRPAMWWRWMPPVSRRALGTRIMKGALGAPALWWYFAQRQSREWLWGDGMTKDNSDAVRDMYFEELEFLEAVFAKQAFILGSHASAADFGYFASMFRHFGNDPDPAEIMRARAPHTYAWLARLWNAKAQALGAKQHWVFPKGRHWTPLLDRIANDYLPYLKANAEAFRDGERRFDFVGKNHSFRRTKTTFYRVWCLEILQRHYRALNARDKAHVDGLFAPVGRISKILNARQISAGMDDLFAMPKPSLKGSHITLSSPRGWRLGAQPRN
ncbi:MAG: glutathione binding-like protein [Pseudomonadota bacterium]|nr:glutathione binding-like protein [Pseudomonadota bacterium]